MRKDLAIGKMGEDNFVKILKKGKLKAKINDKKEDRSYYDIKAEIEGKAFTVEVKNDLYEKISSFFGFIDLGCNNLTARPISYFFVQS